MGWQILSLEYDYNFEAFFPKDSPETEFFKEYRKQFETDNDFILIGIRNDKGIFKQQFLQDVDRLTKALKKLPYVEDVISPTNIIEYRRYAMHPALVKVPYIHLNDTSKYQSDSLRLFSSKEWVGVLVSDSIPSLAVLVKHQQLLSNQGCKELSNKVASLVVDFYFQEVHLAGRSEGQTIYIDIVERETTIFVGASVVLIIMFLFIAYRSFWGIWMPLSVVGLVVLWTMGTMVLTGKKIDLLTNIIPTMLMVIGISAVVHLLTHYLGERSKNKGREEALHSSVKHIGLATVLTTLTTMIGFLTLLTSTVKPVVDLGIYGSIGLVFSLILTYSWFPSILTLHKPIFSNRINSFAHKWNELLNALNQQVQRNYKKILGYSLVFTCLMVYGALQMRQDNYILEGLKKDHPKQIDFTYFEHYFSGARPFEMKLWLSDSNKSVFDPTIINQLNKLHRFLEEEYGVGGLISPISLIKKANQVNHAGKEEYYLLPAKRKKIKLLENDLKRYRNLSKTNLFLNQQHSVSRWVGKVPDLGSFEIKRRDEKLKQFFKNNLDSNLIHYKLTGAANLVDLNNHYTANNVIEGLMIAIALIGIIVGLLFKSIKMALISIVPNVLPLVVTAGVMGFFGIDFNLSTSLIFIIAFGIAVDDSIHFLSRLKYELKQLNHPIELALENTFLSSGKAIIVTTLILSGGFLSLCLSDFLGTFYIGLLICLTLIIALIADLLLLPALLLAVFKKKG